MKKLEVIMDTKVVKFQNAINTFMKNNTIISIQCYQGQTWDEVDAEHVICHTAYIYYEDKKSVKPVVDIQYLEPMGDF